MESLCQNCSRKNQESTSSVSTCSALLSQDDGTGRGLVDRGKSESGPEDNAAEQPPYHCQQTSRPIVVGSTTIHHCLRKHRDFKIIENEPMAEAGNFKALLSVKPETEIAQNSFLWNYGPGKFSSQLKHANEDFANGLCECRKDKRSDDGKSICQNSVNKKIQDSDRLYTQKCHLTGKDDARGSGVRSKFSSCTSCTNNFRRHQENERVNVIRCQNVAESNVEDDFRSRTPAWNIKKTVVALVVLNIVLVIVVPAICIKFTLDENNIRDIINENIRKVICFECSMLQFAGEDVEQVHLMGSKRDKCCIEDFINHFKSLLKRYEVAQSKKDRNLNISASGYDELKQSIGNTNNVLTQLLTRQRPAIHLSSTNVGPDEMPVWSPVWKRGIQYDLGKIRFTEVGLYFVYFSIAFDEGPCNGGVSYRFLEEDATGTSSRASASMVCHNGTNQCQILTSQGLINVNDVHKKYNFNIEISEGRLLLSKRRSHHMGIFKV